MNETPTPTPPNTSLLDKLQNKITSLEQAEQKSLQAIDNLTTRIQAIPQITDNAVASLDENLNNFVNKSERITANATEKLQTTVKNSSEQTINAITDTNKTIADECLSMVQNTQSELQAITASISEFGGGLSDTVKETQQGVLQELEQGDSLLHEHIDQRNPKLIQAMEKQDKELLAQRNQKISETLKFIHPLLITCIFAVVVIAILCAGLIIYTETRISTANEKIRLATEKESLIRGWEQSIQELRTEHTTLEQQVKRYRYVSQEQTRELRQICKNQPNLLLCRQG